MSKTPNMPLKDIWKRDKQTCWICREYCSLENASRDHIIPVSLGGNNSWKNLRLAHKKCNAERGNQIRSVLQSDVLAALQARKEKAEIAALLFQYRSRILWDLAHELRGRGYGSAAKYVEDAAAALAPLENQEVDNADSNAE